MSAERAQRLLSESGLGSCFRPLDAEEAGIDYHQLRRLEEAGIVERERRGLYRRTDIDSTRFSDVAAVCAQVPDSIVCLLTALAVHEIGTQRPHRVWIAIPQGRRTPVLARFGPKVMRFSGISLRYGVVDTEFEGVPARITSPARTVVDCFRFQSRVGTDIAYEALDDALARHHTTPDEIWRTASACRAKSLIGPILGARTY